MNWFILIPLGIAIIALIVFLIKRNQKDEKQYEEFSNNDYPKKPEEEFEED